jgi:hypothetical protein
MVNSNSLHLLDVVALKEPLPQHQLASGQVGTIVELLAPEVYEVEFSDDRGQTYAMLPLHAQQLLKLSYAPHSHLAANSDKAAYSQDLTQAAKDIKALLDQLDQDYDSSTPSGQAMISAKAIAAIEQNPTLKTRVVNVLKQDGTTTLEAAIDHPAVKPVVAMLKGFMDAK